jgi:hypothetical protein
MGADGAATCDLFVTLVHGTWPRGALRDVLLTPFYGAWPSDFRPKLLWFAEGSEFRNRLAAALEKRLLSARISSFLWSGKNSVRERDKAARQLAEHIRNKQLSHPSSTHLLIAHSHGGNVALRALNHLGSAHDEIFIATLATPFVEILPARISPKDSGLTESTWAAFVGVLTLFPILFLLDASGLPYVIGLIAGLLAGMGCGKLFVLWIRRWRVKNAAKVGELVELTSLSPRIRKHPILVLRAADDEASLSLGAAAIGNRLSTLLAKWSVVIFPFLLVGLVGFFLVSAAGANFFQTEPFLSWWKRIDAISIPWLPWIIALVLFVFLFAPGAFKSSYGRELLLNARGCEINSHSAPDTIDQQSKAQSASDFSPSSWGTVVTLHQTAEVRRRRRHGLYNDPQCADRIAGWLKFEFGRRGR